MAFAMDDGKTYVTGATHPSNLDVTIPEADLEKMRKTQKLMDESLVGSYFATPELRWAVPEGTHFPHETRLQQLWTAPCYNGTMATHWRDVPSVVIKKGE